ncbi:hypothetical protein SCUCBS95973_000004 [Sporothrix curviconia]|uniref:Fumarylacetoacetase n=1 Tax=Sporothrix curviconia TaxID=1260050 RepID=A0ABP0AJX5_9PEZI
MASWLSIPSGSHFSLANIPFGIISTSAAPTRRPAVAIGTHVLDLAAFAHGGGFARFSALPPGQLWVFAETTLNAFAALGRPTHRLVRQYLQDVFRTDTPYPETLKANPTLQQTALLTLAGVQTHLPLTIGDYTDFFAGRNHASNVGTLFRGPANALNPNYSHLPVAYHGRSSSVVVSGTPLHRPRGQVLPAPGGTTPVFRPSARLDIELELGAFIGRGNPLGRAVPVDEAEEYIFGYVLMNDWSARDIQQWEYVPLGPFNAKNFGTTISAWVVLADALEPFHAHGLPNDVELQSYLREDRKDNVIAVHLEVDIQTARGNKRTITCTSSENLLWSWPQMVAHHTVSGCNLRTGDLLGSGTISGFTDGTHGSLLEQTKGGKMAVEIGDETRKFLEDGDTVVIRGWSGDNPDALVGFGECTGQILTALA